MGFLYEKLLFARDDACRHGDNSQSEFDGI